MAIDVIDVQKALKGVDYPADDEELAERARENGADEQIVDALRRLPEVEGPSGVMERLNTEVGDQLRRD